MGPTEDITEDAIAALVDRFYASVRGDPELGPLFEGAVREWPGHLARLTDFWSSVMLGTGRYRGQPLQAHTRLPIEPRMFTRWLQLWGQAAEASFAPVPAALFRAKAERIAQSLTHGLFFNPDDIAPGRTGRAAAKV